MGGYKGTSGGGQKGWFTTKKPLPTIPEPIIILTAGAGMFCGFYFKSAIAQYLFLSLALIFATVADLFISFVLTIGLCLFMIYMLKHSTIIRVFLIWILIGILVAAVVAIPFVQQVLGEGYTLLKNSIIILIAVITLIALVMYYLTTRYKLVQKQDIAGYQIAKRDMRKKMG